MLSLRRSPFQIKNAWNQRRTDLLAEVALDQAFLYSKFDLLTWDQLLGQATVLFEKCVAYGRREPLTGYQRFLLMKEFYLERPRAHLDSLGQTEHFKPYLRKSPIVNGRHCLSLFDAKIEIFKIFNRVDFQSAFSHVAGFWPYELSQVTYHPEKMVLGITESKQRMIPDLRMALANWLALSRSELEFFKNGYFECTQISNFEFQISTWATPFQREVATRISKFVQAFDFSKQDLLFLEGLAFLQASPKLPFQLKALSLLSEAVA